MSLNNDNHVTQNKPSIHSSRRFQLDKLAKSAVMLLALGVAATAFDAVADPQDARPAFPNLKFSGKTRGENAVQRLGNSLPEVAAHYRMTTERLTEILRTDKHAWVDASGRLLFIDDFEPPPANATGASAIIGTSAAAPFALADTFLLHSKPGAQRVIYLDFDGFTITGSAWNAGTITAAPFDLDGIPTSFSATEQERIQYIWQRVADDYAQFDIDVTTQEPTADALNRTSSTDQVYGTRAVITRNNFGACSSCGGVAYVGVFDYYSSTTPSYYQPAWIFFDALGSGNEKYVAEAISHEVGHNLGLSHDGTSTVGYYTGHGSGVTGWAPIMGVGYYQNLVEWSKGEYPDANNKEDDILVIQSNGGLLKTDDFGNAMTTAAALAGTASSGVFTVNQSGLIGSSADVDYFSFVAGAGTLTITVTPGVRSPNLDAYIELLDAAGNQVAVANPVDTLDATITVNIPAGAYYLKVDGVGKGDLTTGYSDYGGLGSYTLTGTYAASSALPPIAVATATPTSGYAPLPVGFISDGSYDPDGTIASYTWNFGDNTSSTSQNPTHTYNAPGTYNAVLTVKDSQGLTATKSLTITVAQNPMLTTLHIGNITLTSTTTLVNKKTNYRCVATVPVLQYSGAPGSSAKVTGKWSGVTTSSATTVTADASGLAKFYSAYTTTRGTCTFTVSGVTLSGWTYDPTQNVETSDSLTY